MLAKGTIDYYVSISQKIKYRINIFLNKYIDKPFLKSDDYGLDLFSLVWSSPSGLVNLYIYLTINGS